MKRDPPPPSRWIAALLERLLPGDRADELLGDLHEEFAAVARRNPPLAHVRYARAAAALALHSLARRTLRPARPPAPPGSTSGDPIMSTLFAEIRQAARAMRKRPALTGVIAATLALGLAANAAIFEIIDALILRPFDFPRQERIVLIAETTPDLRFKQETVAPANYLDWRRQMDVFDALAAYEDWDVNIASTDGAERVPGALVTAEFFEVLGVHPARGRGFAAEEEIPGRHRRVVLSHELWQRRFGGDPALVGGSIRLDAEPFEVVGIMPPGFGFPQGSQLWAPLALDAAAAARRDLQYLTVVGRLRADRTLADADAQMGVVAARLAEQHPQVLRDRGADVMTLERGMRDVGLGPVIALWQASAVLVLLIACANVANLLLARAAERQRELAVRLALGASRTRVVREQVVESIGLGLIAVPLALALAALAIRLIRINLPARLTRYVAGWQSMDVDARLIFFTAALALVAAVLCSLLPALRASRAAVAETLKEGGRAATAGRERHGLRRALLVAQIAVALPLLVASALCTMAASRFLHGAQGFDPDGVLVMRTALPEAKYGEPETRRRFVEDTLSRLSRLPGVRSAAVANVIPATGSNSSRVVEIEGRPNPTDASPPTINNRLVTPDLFTALGIPLRKGRGFTAADTSEAQPVAIVSEAAVRRHFADGDPIGRRIRLADGPWLTIVGICGDVIHDWFGDRLSPTVYRPFAQAPTGYFSFVLRSDGDPAALARPAQQALHEVDSAQALYEVMTLRQFLKERTIGLQYVAAIMAAFGGLALLLAVVGVYSLMSFIVTQRTHEIGVRMALGAGRRDVLRLTIGHALRTTAVGAGLGLLASAALGRTLESVLVGVLESDIRVGVGVATVLLAAAVAAGYVPSRRAAAIDPMTAMRQ